MSFDDGAGNPATANCAARDLSGGTATCTVSYAGTGGYPVTASYSGDGAMNKFAPSASTAPAAVEVAPIASTPTRPALTLWTLKVTRCMGTAKGARKNVTVGYTVSARSRVTFTLQRRVKPRRGARTTCPKPLPPSTAGKAQNVAYFWVLRSKQVRAAAR